MRLLIAVLMTVLLLGCGPQIEEGQVTSVQFFAGHYVERCTPQYISIPDGQGGFRRTYIGQSCHNDWVPDQWRIHVEGYTPEGEPGTRTATIYLPESQPPARPGQYFSFSEMRVIPG